MYACLFSELFQQKLSQKVRHIRWKWNVRSKTNAPEKALSSCPKKRKSTLPSIDLNGRYNILFV